MNIFTTNQANQVYVVKNVEEDVADVVKTSAVGTVGVGVSADDKSLYFKHVGAGGLTRSDLIDIDTIMSIKETSADKMARKLKAVKVTLNTEALDSSKPIAGQDFVLRIKFDSVVTLSPDNQYWKYGVVRTTTSTTASDFYKALALSVAKNMAREAVKLVKVGVVVSSNFVEVLANTDTSTLGTASALMIQEVEQDWLLGLKQQRPVSFSVEPTTITVEGNEIVWGDTVDSVGRQTVGGVEPTRGITTPIDVAGTVINSKLMADYEYFYMGERADQYKLKGFPNYVPTEYLVNPKSEFGYDTIGIHYYYVGSNHAVQKSEKDITFILERTADDTEGSLGALAAALLEAIDTAINK